MHSLWEGSAWRLALLLGLCLASLSEVRAEGPAKFRVYFGTYTAKTSKGIYSAELDTASGTLSNLKLAVETESPSFLAIHPSRKFLYAVNELDEVKGIKGGGVSAFAVDPKDGGLTFLNQQSTRGTGPCHLVVDRTGKAVLV
ncbi:lactonase family protein, partial [Singulisphaera rosea]